jgi:hypothetical protein
MRKKDNLDEALEIVDIEYPASIMASATPFFFCTTQKHLNVKRAMSSTA